jgi:hypothetical protein
VPLLATLAFLSALCAGCQAVDAQRSNDPYYQFDGMWCGDFHVDYGAARVAVFATMAELKMPLSQQGPFHHGSFIDTRTPDDFEARIMIVPAGRYSPGTRIGVRVTGFGTHREVCERVLDGITRHLGNQPTGLMIVPGAPPSVMPGPPPALSAPPQVQGSAASLPPQPVPVSP